MVCCGMTLYILFATVATGFTGVHAAFGVQFLLFIVLSGLLAAVVFVYARHHLATLSLVLLVAAIFLAAAKLEPAGTGSPNQVAPDPVAIVDAELARARAAGARLFEERGCSGCHVPDESGVGPALTGRFGQPVADAGCGTLMVDDEYLREAILNPQATVAAGFAPVMPTFAGRVTEEQLRALIAYVRSLGESVQSRGETR